MDDQNSQQNQPPANPAPVPADHTVSVGSQPVDRVEQEELNEVKSLEQEEQTEAQADASKIDERERDGEELEKEEQNPPPPQPNEA